jgi:hypothetical protein
MTEVERQPTREKTTFGLSLKKRCISSFLSAHLAAPQKRQ